MGYISGQLMRTPHWRRLNAEALGLQQIAARNPTDAVAQEEAKRAFRRVCETIGHERVENHCARCGGLF